MFKYFEQRILDLIGKSTAIVCYNDNLAVKLLQFCREHNVNVPNDVSIVGIDDSKYASICDVPLTTVRHPHRKLGEVAAEAILDQIKTHPTDSKDILFTPDLIIRNSVKHLESSAKAYAKK